MRMGSPLPLGVSLQGEGANFAIFSRHATRVWLEFYDQAEDAAPVERIELATERHRTGDVWHVWVQGVQPGQLYAYRMDGPYQPTEGRRFNSRKLLLDPCATAISHKIDWDFRPVFGYDPANPQKDLAPSDIDDAGTMPK